jgi:hypothetical protein
MTPSSSLRGAHQLHYELPDPISTYDVRFRTYEDMARGAATKCAVAGGIGHFAAVGFSAFTANQLGVIPSGFPFAWLAVLVSVLLGLFLRAVLLRSGLSYHKKLGLVFAMCMGASLVAVILFDVRSLWAWQNVVGIGAVGAVICMASAAVNLYEPLTRIARTASDASPEDIADYLKLESGSWSTLSSQILVATITICAGVWYASPFIADQMVREGVFDQKTTDALRQTYAVATGAVASIYVGLVVWAIVMGAMQQGQLARCELLLVRKRMRAVREPLQERAQDVK